MIQILESSPCVSIVNILWVEDHHLFDISDMIALTQKKKKYLGLRNSSIVQICRQLATSVYYWQLASIKTNGNQLIQLNLRQNWSL